MTNSANQLSEAERPGELSFFDQYGLVAESGHFDAAYYSATYSDVASSGADPVLHYLEVGAAELRQPNADFDVAFYMEQCAARGIRTNNALLHFLLHGQHLGLKTRRDDTGAAAPDESSTIGYIIESGLFDRHFYNALSRADFVSDAEAVRHFLAIGTGLGRRPNPYFDPVWYLQKYPDVKRSGLQPLAHYIGFGDAEGRQPSRWFDTAWYRGAYAVPKGGNALAHYLSKRKTGLFSPVPDFDVNYYAEANKDLRDAGIDLFEHYLATGCAEGRTASPKFGSRYYVNRYIGNDPSTRLQMASDLAGSIEKVTVGDGFAVISGWVADGKQAAKEPLSINLNGQSFGPITLQLHKNLAKAGVAGGRCGFSVVIPAGLLAVGRVVDLTVFDASFKQLRAWCQGARVVPFVPTGAIEEVGPEGITGWVFDPRLHLRQRKAILRYDEDYDELIDLTVSREMSMQDLTQIGEPRIGFKKDITAVLERLRKFSKKKKSEISIKLVSSGEVLWTQTIPLGGGQAAATPGDAAKAPAVAAAAPAMPGLPWAWTSAGKKPRMLVVSWDMGHNPVGRAYLMADIARADYDVKLIGPQFKEYGSALWEPLRGQTTLPINIFPGGPLTEYLSTILKVVEDNPADVVYVSKPRLPSLIFGYLMQLRHGCPVVVDSDDHELSFFKSDVPLTIAEAISAARADPEGARQAHSEIWTRLGEHLLGYAGAITVSNIALQQKFGGTIVRHARDEKTFNVSAARRTMIRREFGIKDHEIAVVFLGTPRPHKGIFKVAEALDRIKDPRLVFVIVGTITDARTRTQLNQYKNANIRFFDNQPWSRLHEIVAMADVVPVLQVNESRIADYQIPAKLTDAMALDVPVLATRVAPLADFGDSGAMLWIESDADLEKALRKRLNSATAMAGIVKKATALYQSEFTYAVNAARIKSAVEEARKKKMPPQLREALVALYQYAQVPLPFGRVTPVESKGKKRKGPRDLVFFWKQNDTDLYGRRSDMMMKYLLDSGKVRKILQFDRPLNLQQMNSVVDRGKFAAYHEGNLVYLNTTRRLLKLSDNAQVAKRTFLHRSGTLPQTFFGQDLPPKEAYGDFVREAMAECGIDPHPLAWVCPVVFDFPEIEQAVGFEKIVVDIIDDQRRWKSQESYMRRIEQNYIDVLKLGDLVLSNCEPVRDGFRELRDDIMVVPNGAELFHNERRWSLPPELADLPRPIIGYVGNLRDRVDIGAIRELAEKRPKWSVVLIGSAGGSLDVLALGELKNVHLLGVRPYEQALHYIKNFDVAIMPHLKNAISENMNPLKLYVYFALGVPIVTTNVSNIGEVGPYVSIADTTKDFIRAVEANLKGKGPKVPPATRKAALAKVSWKSRVDQVLSNLKL